MTKIMSLESQFALIFFFFLIDFFSLLSFNID